MKVEFEETREDLYALSFEATKRIGNVRNMMILIGTMGGLFLLTGLLFFMLNVFSRSEDMMRYVFSLVGMGLGVYIMIRFIVLRDHFIRSSVRRTLSDRRIHTYLGWNSIEISEKGVRRRNAYRDERLYWKGVMNIIETKEHIFIHDTDVSAFIVPKRAFASKNEMREFLRFAKEMMKNSRTG